MRLLALKSDGHAFGPLHDIESKYTAERWYKRLNNPEVFPFIAYTGDSLDGGTWAGIVHLLGPTVLQAGSWVRPKGVVTEDEEVYMVMGIWVHPDHRHQGLGKRLIDVVKKKFHGEGVEKEMKVKVLVLIVRGENMEAKEMFVKAGFQDRGYDEDLGGFWMTMPQNRRCLPGNPTEWIWPA